MSKQIKNLKGLPLSVATAIVEYVNLGRVKVEEENGCLIKLVENVDDPEFYFTIIHVKEVSNNDTHVQVEKKPFNDKNINPKKLNIVPQDFKGQLDLWFKVVDSYNLLVINIPEYEIEKLEEELGFVDNDGDNIFTIEEISRLDAFFSGALLVIAEAQKNDGSDKRTLAMLNDDVLLLKDKAGVLTKSEMRRRIFELIAKSKRLGLDFIKKIVMLGRDELLKVVVREGVDSVIQKWLA